MQKRRKPCESPILNILLFASEKVSSEKDKVNLKCIVWQGQLGFQISLVNIENTQSVYIKVLEPGSCSIKKKIIANPGQLEHS